jgi:hypothetical protein
MQRRIVAAVAIAMTGLASVLAPHAGATLLPSQRPDTVIMIGNTFGSTSNSGGTIHGGCYLALEHDPTTDPWVYQGVAGVIAVTTDAGGTPVQGVVTCYITDTGVDASPYDPGPQVGGYGNQVGAEQKTVLAVTGDTVTLCEDAWIGTVPAPRECRVVTTETTDSPQILTETMVSTVDPLACPFLSVIGSALGGGITDVLEIRPDGDVYIADGPNPVYDCVPYWDY